ncbi:MAG: hypothetical protein KTR25_02820 [Myxococcales bacterium]|nr:hypothetical protein [Myxococcales bacterium]
MVFGVLFFTACGTDNGGPVLPIDEDNCLQANFTSIHQLISSQRCASSGCHTGDNAAGQLDLSAGEADVYAQLVNSPTADSEAVSDFPMRVTPNNADRSYFFHIMAEDNPTGSSLGRMPPGGALLDCDIEAISTWINDGATQAP